MLTTMIDTLLDLTERPVWIALCPPSKACPEQILTFSSSTAGLPTAIPRLRDRKSQAQLCRPKCPADQLCSYYCGVGAGKGIPHN